MRVTIETQALSNLASSKVVVQLDEREPVDMHVDTPSGTTIEVRTQKAAA